MRAVDELEAFVAVLRAASVPFERPDRLPKALAALAPWGTNPAGLLAAAAARYPNRVAVVDDDGSITYHELWRNICGMRRGLEAGGVGRGSRVALLMRNHRRFFIAFGAAAATGADIVLCNTGFGAAQLGDVIESEGVGLLIRDDEFGPLTRELTATTIGDDEMDTLCRGRAMTRPNRHAGRVVILTSGTTGRPKGAVRAPRATTLTGVGAVLERVPLRAGDVQYLAAPAFHAWGFSNLLLGVARCATTIVARRFDPIEARRSIDHYQARVLVAVPVMLHRIVEADHSPMRSVEVIAASGSAIPAGLAQRIRAAFGDVLYNLYGSTEVSVASIATPGDLARHPDTAGRPALGVTIRILDGDARPVPDGQIGRVFVGSASRFDGYTDGDGKEEHDNLLSSGDLGVIRNGLLFIEGREDDMIVSGGENVYPSEVEHLLSTHPAVSEVAVVGVPDDEFGQVMAAFVVAAPGVTVDADGIRAHVGRELARHKAPRRVVFVDQLPRNETGKVLRTVLADTVVGSGVRSAASTSD